MNENACFVTEISLWIPKGILYDLLSCSVLSKLNFYCKKRGYICLVSCLSAVIFSVGIETLPDPQIPLWVILCIKYINLYNTTFVVLMGWIVPAFQNIWKWSNLAKYMSGIIQWMSMRRIVKEKQINMYMCGSSNLNE